MHTCDQLHLLPGGELESQQHLTYNRVWVDYEMTPARWYTLASPLQSVFAGDMYMPTDGARQETELFQNITFSTTQNNRFSPAVYQRGWDKGTATLYQLDGSERNTAIRANWSSVYNDVTVAYTPGAGFSIKTEVEGESTESVLMRLPKEDESYTYYKEDKTTNNRTGDVRTDEDVKALNGKLITFDDNNQYTLTLTNATTGKYFLVGNPFICRLDMAEFFEKNTALNGKFWIVSAEKQGVGLLTTDGTTVSTDGTTSVAPLQSFFVEATTATTELEVVFTPDMMTSTQEADVLTRSAEASSVLRLTTLQGGEAVSRALVCLSDEASEGYADAEDVAALMDTNLSEVPLVYTVAGTLAVSINSLPAPEMLPLGIEGGTPGEQVDMRIEGIEAWEEGLTLYDADLDEQTPVHEGEVLALESGRVGRYYLMATRSIPADEADNALRITATRGEVRVTAAADDAVQEVRAFDVNGRAVHLATRLNTNEYTFRLPSGVYVIGATSIHKRSTMKLFVP